MDEIERRLMILEAREAALTQLLLSLIAASDDNVVRSTRLFAEDQRRKAVELRNGLAALILGDLLETIAQVRPTAVNG